MGADAAGGVLHAAHQIGVAGGVVGKRDAPARCIGDLGGEPPIQRDGGLVSIAVCPSGEIAAAVEEFLVAIAHGEREDNGAGVEAQRSVLVGGRDEDVTLAVGVVIEDPGATIGTPIFLAATGNGF